jgi:hypothetical protein
MVMYDKQYLKNSNFIFSPPYCMLINFFEEIFSFDFRSVPLPAKVFFEDLMFFPAKEVIPNPWL